MPKHIVPSIDLFFNTNEFVHKKRASGAHSELRNFWQPKRTMLDIAAEAEAEEEDIKKKKKKKKKKQR